MKKIIVLSLILISTIGCNEKEPLTEIQCLKKAEKVLLKNQEKIVLISILENISMDTVHLILKDYYAKRYQYKDKLKNKNFILGEIDTISQKRKLPKRIVAKIIFAYRYELISKKEIIQNYKDAEEQKSAEKFNN